MSDEDEENDDREVHGMFIPVGGASREMIDEARRQHELANSRGEDLRVRLDSMVDSMSAEHLYTLKMLLGYVANSANSFYVLHYLEGQITAVLRIVHQTCIKCGENHTTSEHGLEALMQAGPFEGNAESDGSP